jgi:hypothetical protein
MLSENEVQERREQQQQQVNLAQQLYQQQQASEHQHRDRRLRDQDVQQREADEQLSPSEPPIISSRLGELAMGRNFSLHFADATR